MRHAPSPRLSLLALSCFAFALPANAHISLEKGGTHLSRYGDAQTDLKDAPCGHVNGPRGPNVYTYAPGATITVSVVETVPHPSYFRIAFDDDGDDAFIDPASIDPIDPARACPDGLGDHCGASDFNNSPAVLMDDLNPHLPAAGDFLNPPKYTWQVKLPDVECTNCTLQIIQVMEDDAFHGPYDPTPGVGVADIYHQCIDLVLTSGPGGAGGATGAGGTTAMGGATGTGGTTGAGAGGGATGAGGTIGAGAGGAVAGTGGTGPGVGGTPGVDPGSVGAGGAAAGTGSGGVAGASGPQGSASSDQSGGCSLAHAPSRGVAAGAWLALALAASAAVARRRRATR